MEDEQYRYVTETFRRCAPPDWANQRHFKSFVRRDCIDDVHIHYARTNRGRRVLTDFRDVADESMGIAHDIAYIGIQLNHYQTKTWADFQRRMRVGDAFYPDGHPGKEREATSAVRFAALDRNDVEDRTIDPFLPAMHVALRRLQRALYLATPKTIIGKLLGKADALMRQVTFR